MTPFEIIKPLKNLAGGALDANRGPYETVEEACIAIPSVVVGGVNFREGKQVDIGIGGVYRVWWWQGGYDDADLVEMLVNGFNGWQQSTEIEIVDGRALRKLVGYFGGTGIEPTLNVGKYEGVGGWVTDPIDATDFLNDASSEALAIKANNDNVALRTTITGIRALTGSLKSTQFYTTDIGQEGNWYYDASDTTSADNTGTILVTADGKRLKRVVDGIINVKWFGALGDGINNDAIVINKALDANYLVGGTVVMEKPSVRYLIGTPLLICSNTTLLIDEGAELYLANNVNNVMIGNKNKTTAATPTIIDENITIIGGIWNGNRLNQTKWSGTPNTSILVTLNIFSGVRNLKILNGKYINSRTYGMLISNVDCLLINNCNVDVYTGIQDNGDGIHLLGLCKNFTITNTIIKSDDNFIALNADDVAHGPNGLFGKIENGFINNITVNNNEHGQGLRLLSGTSPIHKVTFSNIKGSAAYLAVLSTLDLGVGDFDDITFENIAVEFMPSLWNYFEMVGTFGNVTFNNIHIKSDPTVLATKAVDRYFYILSQGVVTPNTEIKRLTVNNIQVSDLKSTAAGIGVFVINNNVDIETLSINQLSSKGNSKPTKIVVVVNGSAIERLYTSNLDVDYTNNSLIQVDGSSSITKHFIDGATIETFIPVIKGSTTAGTGTYSVQKGLYSIGNGLVNFQIEIAWSAHDGTGQIVIDLPKGVKNTSVEYEPVNVYKSGIALSAGEMPKAMIYRNASRIQMYKETPTALNPLFMVTSGQLTISGFYYLNTLQ